MESAANGATELQKAAGNFRIHTENPNIEAFLENANEALVRFNKLQEELIVTTKDGRQMVVNGVKITEDLSRISNDSANFVGNALNKKTPWWQKYLLTPLKVAAGAGILYFELKR
jgi:hypothetical protein